ncbi:MAG: ABC transporter ATP-binding protein [Chloroflexi bacterium]|nr:ABC transporter ATP-binding protein [Chloroflexota bacterium]
MMSHDWILREEARKPRAVGETLARFWAYFKAYRLVLIAVGLLVVASTYTQVVIPDLMGQAVDCYLTPATRSALAPSASAGAPSRPQADQGLALPAPTNCWFATVDPAATPAEHIAGLGGLILLIAGLYVAGSLLTGLLSFLMAYAGQNVVRALRVEVFNHLHRLSLGYFTRHEAGDVMSRITNDADTVQLAVQFPLISVIQGALLIVWVAYAMLSKSPAYALVALAVTPAMFFATSWFSNRARQAFRQVRSRVGDVNANLQENLSAVREAQAFQREEQNIQTFAESNAASRDASILAVSYTSALQPTLEALGYVAIALVAGVGGLVLLSGQTLFGSTMSLGLIVAFIAYTQRFHQPISAISVLWTNIQSAIAGGERIFGLLDEVPDLPDAPGAVAIPPIAGRVVFDGVWAEYQPGQPVLRDVSLVAEPGQTIAIVGPTGAGKTTLVHLIPRFYDVTSGSITVDGFDVREVTAASLRGQIGMVLQDSFLFSDTVMNNIRYGRPSATDAEVVAAAKLARADTFVERLPQGYDTVLGERGSGLSLGQRQLLAIARAALASPRILILDEATSSVDTRTERLIQRALEDLLRGRTSFVIAHRLSTIRHADQVLAIQDGQIVERGTHEELLRAHGFYYDLYMSQFRRDREFTEAVPVASP